jgi:hypothetical protein
MLAGDLEISQKYYKITQLLAPDFKGLDILKEQIELIKPNR